MAEINTHKEICNTVLEELVTSQSSKMVSREKYDMIFNHLKNPSDKVLAKFRFWVKEKGFYLIDLPAGGLKDVVVLPNKATEIGSPSYVRVIPSDMVYEFVYQCHVKELNHAGARNTTNVLKRSFLWDTIQLCTTLRQALCYLPTTTTTENKTAIETNH